MKKCRKILRKIIFIIKDPNKTMVIIAAIALLLSFLCYKQTSKALNISLEQASIELRPWVIIPKINIQLFKNYFSSQIKIKNIGKTPSYIKMKLNVYEKLDVKNYEKVDVEKTDSETIVLMPTQLLKRNFHIGDELYKKILENKYIGKIMVEIKISYGTKKGSYDFFTYYKLKLNTKKLLFVTLNKNKASNVWDIIDSDFK